MFQFFQSGINSPTFPEEIENFYCFIEELEENAKTDSQFYELVADCYAQIYNQEKAKEAFLKINDSANKKHQKKMKTYNSIIHEPIKRLGKKATTLPDFPYVAPEIASKMFVAQPGKKCCICRKEAPAFYAGHAYTKDEKYITFLFDEEKFCADCLENGDAARQLNITFQLPYINGFAAIPQKYRDAILKKTPSCSADFALYHEDAWPTCCNDFCCYQGPSDYTTFTFTCRHCGKKVSMCIDPESPYEEEDFEDEDF